MTPLEMWRYKVLQTLHDPIDKMAIQGLLAHQGVANEHIEALTRSRERMPFKAPDRLATGADRPVAGDRKICQVNWRLSPVVTHPLQPGLRLAVEWDALPTGSGAKLAAGQLEAKILQALKPLAVPAGGWELPAEVEGLLLRLWRRAPEILQQLGLQAPYLPADSRCPDHSTWDHTRVASAAAFLVEMTAKNRPPEREPWMIAFSLGGVERFLEETRKTRDLWTASMIYADLAWAAMLPIVERLGPDAILYPDLRGNPTADRWLLARCPDAVPQKVRQAGATTHAAMLPNTFVALAPRGGGDSGLPDVEELAGLCVDAVRQRWRQLAEAVGAWMESRVGRGSWREIWARQVDGRLGEPPVFWVAVPWERRMDGLGNARRGPALPGQSPAISLSSPPQQLVERERALSPWLPHRVWAHYEIARDVFWHTDTAAGTTYLTAERGFDYPLVHHQLRAVLAMRKATALPRALDEPGEKCSLTGREEVLHNGAMGSGPLVIRRREGARKFWARFDAEGAGGERLGATAAVKRFLVRAAEPSFTATWESPAEFATRGSGEPRVPFPSMAAIAAGSFVEVLAACALERPVAAAIREFVAAFRQTGLEETVDSNTLPAFARARSVGQLDTFLRIEPEHLFPETLEPLVRQAQDSAVGARLERFRRAAVDLRSAAAAAGVPPPRKLVAALRMDGDAISRLILGDPRVLRTTWEDVLHPEAAEQLRSKLAPTGWPGLLAERRHMGPALHAAITRSLADFAQKMVAWVVEHEYNGRLVYAGGDDLLALLPAVEAIPAAARLQQLFSAPFVLDTDSDTNTWSWRSGEAHEGPTLARQRFRVPTASGSVLRLSDRRFEDHAGGDPTSTELPSGRAMALHTMLGRAHSLSAGLAIGHFKTPLATMLRTAGELLECEAKERSGRSALAITLLSGGGDKATFASRWRPAEPGPSEVSQPWSDLDAGPPEVQRHLLSVMDAFRPHHNALPVTERPRRRARLPGRLAYKLREKIRDTGAILLDPEHARSLVPPLVRMESGLSKDRDSEILTSTSALINCGLDYARRLADEQLISRDLLAQLAVAGLLVTRKLASDGEDRGPA